MRFKPLLMLATLSLLMCAPALAQDQQKDQQVIDDFVTTRGVSFDDPGKTTQTQKHSTQPAAPRRNNSSASSKSPGANTPSGSLASNKSPSGKSNTPAKSPKGEAAQPGKSPEVLAQAGGESTSDTGVQTLNASASTGGPPRPIALGYTILMKDGAGNLMLVDQSREFKTGDRLAVALETNTDGYLYMFNATDGKNPELLFPSVLLDEGANALQAHARATFPADTSFDFEFTDPAATEHLFVIFSRQPLAGVPTGEELAKFCGKNRKDCAWKPTAAQWERIKSEAKGRGVTEAKNTQLAQAGPQPVMPNTLQRGLKVKRDDPKPAVVRVNDSANSNTLVTEIVLVHK
ncbi:MAG: hypothetical protein QOC61_184 [Acidobacteriota bacterium]|jgi:hypothetical protein|nr:hypothetical protein [Acidobacteriota bacterium]MDT5261180.1 hypothetical protein [Acidobacteriota bacterium]MDT7777509.1 hypothetical protein [Acidobacteriota bacterium]